MSILVRAGVTVGISVTQEGNARNLLWEAGWAQQDAQGGIGEAEAVGLVTWNVADSVGVGEVAGRIVVGRRAGFVGFDGAPVAFGSTPQIIGDGHNVVCWPVQD